MIFRSQKVPQSDNRRILVVIQTLLVNLLFSLTTTTIISVKAFSASTNNRRKTSGGTGFGSSSKVEKKYIIDPSIEIQNLYKFLDINKAEYKNSVEVGIDIGTGRRGLYTTKAFNAKEKIICRIPSDVAVALSDPSKGGDDVPTIAHCGANFITMYQKDQAVAEQWAPYFDTIPKSIDPAFKTPNLYSSDEISLLEFPKIVSKSLKRKQDIEQVANERQLSVQELQYATYIVSTRSFPLAISDMNTDSTITSNDEDGVVYDERGQVMTKSGSDATRKYVHILLPLLDIVNHSSDKPNVRLIIQDARKDLSWFCFETIRPIPAGTELLRSYGSTADSSVELLLNYGFIPVTNNIDTFMLKKGGDGCLRSLNDWTTTLEEDKQMLHMLPSDSDDDSTLNLRSILQFRIRLKESYA